jgi:short-subunit dehydrogenase
MSIKLKKLADQVFVITGASSGIGLATAEAAAKAGAKLVLAARSEKALAEIAARLGPDAVAVRCDVAERTQVERVGEAAVAKFGRIDTWVNNAGLGMYGRLDECDDADSRRLFDINYWGVVNGCLAALRHLKPRGGALITVGSEVSESFAPLLGQYVASKHAVKGFIDTLRVETEDIDKAPVAITLIQPTAVDTPFPQHARNYQAWEPKLPDPMIEPAQVAAAILAAAERPTRDHRVGGGAKLSTTVASLFPSLMDRMAAKQADKQHYDEKPRHPKGALNQPSAATGVVGRTHGTGGKEPK